MSPKSNGEVHIPPRNKPANDDRYLSILTQAVFQAGFSWQVVRDKWPDFERAFDEFSIGKVASYDDRDVERLVGDTGIVRNGRKIQATIDNAQAMRDLIGEHGSFEAYLRTMDELPYPERRKALTDRFKWLGKTGAFFFLWSVAEEVPDWEQR